MDKLIAYPQATGQPLRPEDWEFIQETEKKLLNAIVMGLIPGQSRFIIQGCKSSVVGGYISISEGYFFDSAEISYIPDATFAVDFEKTLYFTQVISSSESRTFKDQSQHNVYEIRRYEVGYAVTPPEGSYIFSSQSMLEILSASILAQVQTESIGLKYLSVPFRSSDLDRAQQLIPAPGEGKVIKVISASAKIQVTTRLDAGTQNLNLSYGGDTTSEDIGHFPNRFLEAPIDSICDMIPQPGDMTENTFVAVGFSAEVPSTGEAVVIVYVIYKIIDL